MYINLNIEIINIFCFVYFKNHQKKCCSFITHSNNINLYIKGLTCPIVCQTKHCHNLNITLPYKNYKSAFYLYIPTVIFHSVLIIFVQVIICDALSEITYWEHQNKHYQKSVMYLT